MTTKYLIKLGVISALICGVDAQVENKVVNIIEKVDFITFNGNITLVPKNALLQIPEKYKPRINNHKPGSKFLRWNEFYTQNRGWISTLEVTLTQVNAETPISPEVLETLIKKEKLVVAVFKNSPVSVRPPKVEAEVKN